MAIVATALVAASAVGDEGETEIDAGGALTELADSSTRGLTLLDSERDDSDSSTDTDPDSGSGDDRDPAEVGAVIDADSDMSEQDGIEEKVLSGRPAGADPAAPSARATTTTTEQQATEEETTTTTESTTSSESTDSTGETGEPAPEEPAPEEPAPEEPAPEEPAHPDGWVDAGHGVYVPPVLLKIRFCESTDNYQAANPSSSARGAYQFLTGSWAAYGHADRYGVTQAHLATNAQQDEAALITWQEAGTTPWNASKSCWNT